MTQTLREKYIANEILKIGDIVEDSATGKSYKIIDRGSNYITVDGADGVCKKWINEVKFDITEEKTDSEFFINNGQLKMFGYQTRNFYTELSEFVIEQFSEFKDTYSKHQIVKLLDNALVESDINKKYELFDKVNTFYVNNKVAAPLIVEAMKNDLERRRIVEILATVAGSDITGSVYTTAVNAVKALKEKYKQRMQWEVLWPFLKMANDAGISGVMQNLPYNLEYVKTIAPKVGVVHEQIIELLEDNLDDLVSEFKSEYVTGTTYRDTSDLMQQSKQIAEAMIVQSMFQKPVTALNSNETCIADALTVRRNALVANLAQKLIKKVQNLQTKQVGATE